MSFKISPFYNKPKNENKAINVIQNNNAKSTASLAGGEAGRFVAKNIIKQGLKKYVGPVVGKVFGVATTMLSSQKAHARQQPEPEWYSGPSPFDKKMGEFKHSDAPDAKGKFKELSTSALASWLIKTRKGNLSKIISSLNQQVVFNRKKNPSYAKKMKTTMNIVRKRLGKNEDKS